ILALGVGPDVGLGPMQDRMNPQVRARRRRGVELVPEFRRLVTYVPSAFGAARREHPLLGAGGFLIAANAGDQAVETIFGQRQLFQPRKGLAKDVDALRLKLVEMIHREPLGLIEGGMGEATIAAGCFEPVRSVRWMMIVEKMHLCRLVFGVKNSIVASQQRR